MQAEHVNQTGIASDIKQFISSISFSSTFFILILKYLVIGFVSGFLIKTFGRYVFFVAVIGFSSIWLLDMAGLVSVNYLAIQSFFGISSQEAVAGQVNEIFQWIKDNISLFVAFSLGFYLAWELS